MMEKQASNFELNILKIGVHTIQLVKGDRFESNGSAFNYVPSTKENMGKGTYIRWHGRSNTLSAKKYEKDVLRADNIELISEKLVGFKNEEEAKAEEELRKAEKWKATCIRTWEVKYAYKIEIPKNENIVILTLELGGKYSNDETKKVWEFKTEELPVKRVTAEMYFLGKDNPVTYHSQIRKSELNNVRLHHDRYYVLCLMDDYDAMEMELFKFVEKAVNDKIEQGHAIVKRETINLNKFMDLKTKQGY